MKKRKVKTGTLGTAGATVPVSSNLAEVSSGTQMEKAEAKNREAQNKSEPKPPQIPNPALMAFLVELASNLDRLTVFVADPAGTAEKAGLSQEDRAVLFSGDQTKIYLAIASPPPVPAPQPQPTPAAQPGQESWASYYGAQPQPAAWGPAGSQPAGAGQWGAAPQQANPWQSSGAAVAPVGWPAAWGAPAQQPQYPASGWPASPGYPQYGQNFAPFPYIIVWTLPSMWPSR